MYYHQLPPNDPRRIAFEQGLGSAKQYVDHQLGETTRALRQDFERRQNDIAAMARRNGGQQLERRVQHLLEQADNKLDAISRISDSLLAHRSGGGGVAEDAAYVHYDGDVVRIEDIPGRRVPYTFLVEIPIGADVVSTQEGAELITQEGPFVATKRMAIFQSNFQFEFEDPATNQQARVPGRSFGRWRPVSSAVDVLDSIHNAYASTDNWFLHANDAGAAGDVLPCGVLAQASSASSFRTMTFDGRVEVRAAGSEFPRQRIPTPTAFWATDVQGPFELSAVDFFSRNELITFKVTPGHVNNPPAGNVDSRAVFPLAAAAGIVGYPFLEGQYDPHEGIATADCVTLNTGPNDFVPVSTDPITRLPDGILYIGYEGYRIVQVTGPPQ